MRHAEPVARSYFYSASAAAKVIFVIALTTGAQGATINLSDEIGAASGFALLAMNGGTMTINSSTSILGNIGYSSGVVSNTNQKVDTFAGTAYVSSGAAFTDTPATFQPTGGIVVGGAADTQLNAANTDLASAAAYFAGLGSATSLGAVTTSLSLTRTGDVNVYDLTSLNFNSNTLTLTGNASDAFIFRVGGNFTWSQSQTILNGVSAGQVLFYFGNASSVDINKSTTVFDGTILAPQG